MEMNFKLTEASFSVYKRRFFTRSGILFLIPLLIICYSTFKDMTLGSLLHLVVYLMLILFLVVKNRQYFDKTMQAKKSFQITLQAHEIIQNQEGSETIRIQREDVVRNVEYSGNSGCVISRDGQKIIFPNTIERFETLMTSLAEWQPVEVEQIKFFQSTTGQNILIFFGLSDICLFFTDRNPAMVVITGLPVFACLIYGVYYYRIRNGGENRKKFNPIVIILAWLVTIFYLWMSWGRPLLHH